MNQYFTHTTNSLHYTVIMISWVSFHNLIKTDQSLIHRNRSNTDTMIALTKYVQPTEKWNFSATTCSTIWHLSVRHASRDKDTVCSHQMTLAWKNATYHQPTKICHNFKIKLPPENAILGRPQSV